MLKATTWNCQTVNCIYTVLLVKHSVEKKKRTLTSLKFEKKNYFPTYLLTSKMVSSVTANLHIFKDGLKYKRLVALQILTHVLIII